MLIPFLKLELSIDVDDSQAERGIAMEFFRGPFSDPEVYERYRKVIELAVEAVLKEMDNAEGK